MQQGMWKGRFQQDMNAKVLAYSQSLDLDWRLLPWDVQGSKAQNDPDGTRADIRNWLDGLGLE